MKNKICKHIKTSEKYKNYVYCVSIDDKKVWLAKIGTDKMIPENARPNERFSYFQYIEICNSEEKAAKKIYQYINKNLSKIKKKTHHGLRGKISRRVMNWERFLNNYKSVNNIK